VLSTSLVCAQEQSVSDIAEEAMPCVVQIIAYDITGTPRGHGTGFFIEPGKILTNAHVVNKAYSIEIISDMEYHDEITIMKSDEDIDLALVSVDVRTNSFLTFEPKPEIRPGQRIITIGNPMGLEKTVSDGLISAIRVFDDIQVIQISAPISPGSSGGPLLNEHGYVIGVTSATLEEGQNLNFAIGIKTIRNFLKRPNNPQPLHPAGSRVMWRVILKWTINIILGLIALALGGGWWIIIIVILLFTFIAWAIKGLWNLALSILRKKRINVNYEPENNSHSFDEFEEGLSEQKKLFDEEKTQQENKSISFRCWKCGTEVKVGIDDMFELVECDECGTKLEVPEELLDY